jgi:hypothetical protein
LTPRSSAACSAGPARSRGTSRRQRHSPQPPRMRYPAVVFGPFRTPSCLSWPGKT